jgi:hypothetical protein
MTDDSRAITRRDAIGATGAAFAVGVGAAAPAAAHCDACDETASKFCPNECVATAEEAEAYDKCPFDALSYVTTVPEGRTGFVWDTCEDNCTQAVKVRFDCDDVWWIKSSDIESAYDCTC